MTPTFFLQRALVPAMTLLPLTMDSLEARAMVIAICLQESRLIYRQQLGGPAHGYAQFELGGGVRGVLTHAASKRLAQAVLGALDYSPGASPAEVYAAIEHHDILAAALARLLLWTLPQPLPGQNAPDLGWQQYLQAWRPGKPHRDTWDGFFNQAWATVLKG
jgi:hypothetical protein